MKTNEFYPIGCDHKKPDGFSAWSFMHESSGSSEFQTSRVFVCLKCGDFSVSGTPADGKRFFNYEGHVIIKREFAAMLRQAAFFNEQSVDEFVEDLKKEVAALKEVWPDKNDEKSLV
jgi:hypothetical protein